MARAKRFIQNDNTNAICYYRYSSDAQRDVSIEQQRQEAHKYAKAHGYHIIKEYEDRAITGTRDDRPGFQQMLNEVEKLKPAYLIIWKSDRLSRDRFDSIIAKRRLRDCGCEIAYVAEAVPEDEANRVLMESLLEGLAEHFIIQHSKNVRRGQEYNAHNALYNGIKLLGYIGKPNCKYEIDPTTAPIVQRIFNDYANGKPMKKICDELNEAGLRSSTGNKFVHNSLWNILQNRAYIGEYKWGGIVVEDGMPAIISKEVFEKAQEMMKRHKRGGRGEAKKLHPLIGVDFWLTEHLKCGECGGSMCGMSGTSRHGNIYYYYSCMNHRKHKCDKKNIRKDFLEKCVAEVLEEMLSNTTVKMLIAAEVYNYYKREFASDDNYEKVLINNIKDIDKKLNNIMKAIENGIYNETTQERMEQLQEEKRQLNDELVVEQNRKAYELKPKHVVKFLDSYIGSMNEPSLRDKVLNCLVENIYVFDDRIVLSFYYSEDKREVRFEDVKARLENVESIMSLLNGQSGNNPKNHEKMRIMQESILDADEDEYFFA